MTSYLEHRRALKLGQVKPEKKPCKKIAPFSKKRAKLNREYAIKSGPFWKGKQCAIKSPGCQKEATGIHHMKGKDTPELLMDERYWLPACGYCNTVWLEENDAEARRLGFKLSRLNK
jgi:hypothetical protein